MTQFLTALFLHFVFRLFLICLNKKDFLLLQLYATYLLLTRSIVGSRHALKEREKNVLRSSTFLLKKVGKRENCSFVIGKKEKKIPGRNSANEPTDQRCENIQNGHHFARRGFIFLKKTVEKATLQFTCEMVQNGVDVVLLTFPP